LIKMKIEGLDELKKLSKQLKDLKKEINKESTWAVKSLYKSMTVIYEGKIYELVYNQYDPEKYKRTYHLLGGHGAKDELLMASGVHKTYDFSIDEDSRDPVDGTTWREKADAIEHGATEMHFGNGQVPFNRPFIDETQRALEFEAKRTADEFERYVNKLLDDIAKG